MNEASPQCPLEPIVRRQADKRRRKTGFDEGKREPKPTMILRLLAEAQAGVKCEVSLAAALEFRRDQYDLTQRDFAALLGLSQGKYGQVLNGKMRLSLESTKRAYAIGVPADALLQW